MNVKGDQLMGLSLLCMHSVGKIFDQDKLAISVLSGADAIFEQGKTYALLGISGTGKSTILQLLAGVDRPSSGKITFNAKDLALFTDAEHERFLHEDIGLVFQMPYLIDELSVCENVMIKGLMGGENLELNRKRATLLLQQLGLEQKIDAYPRVLSGGEQQRVALARAVFAQPKFLLADEPTAHLDRETKQLIMKLLIEMQKKSGMGVIIATHDQEVAAFLDTHLRIHLGKLVLEG